MKSDFDQRQLRKMHTLIESYKNHSIPLPRFINDMEFLFHVLESVDECWEELFLEEISSLESVNAGVPKFVSDRGVQNILYKSVDNLDKYIRESICKSERV